MFAKDLLEIRRKPPKTGQNYSKATRDFHSRVSTVATTNSSEKSTSSRTETSSWERGCENGF